MWYYLILIKILTFKMKKLLSVHIPYTNMINFGQFFYKDVMYKILGFWGFLFSKYIYLINIFINIILNILVFRVFTQSEMLTGVSKNF